MAKEENCHILARIYKSILKEMHCKQILFNVGRQKPYRLVSDYKVEEKNDVNLQEKISKVN